MPSTPMFGGNFQVPGIESALKTVDNIFYFGRYEDQVWTQGIIDDTARDAGNTVTTVLRPGLMLGQIAATGKLKEWNPTGTDGSQYIYGILGVAIEVSANGTDTDRYVGQIMYAGHVKSARVIEPGQATLGLSGEDWQFAIMSQTQGRIRFDDYLHWDAMPQVKTRLLAVADTAGAGITLTGADVGKLIVTRGSAAQAVTLPDPKVGYQFEILSTTDQNLTILTASGSNVILVNDLAGDGVVFSTAANKIGARARFTAINIPSGVFYVVTNTGGTTMTSDT
jgi:hypothetical protein